MRHNQRIDTMHEAVEVILALHTDIVRLNTELTEARQQERERCAKVADDYHKKALIWAKKIRGLEQHIDDTDSSRIADDIRAMEDS